MGAIYFVIGQIGWFACVLTAAHGLPWLGTGVALLAVAAHLCRARRPLPELYLIACVALLGGLWDTLVVRVGWLSYPGGSIPHGVAPYWIVALWALFAAQFNTTYRWLKSRLLVSALLGGVAGPVTFHGGASLGALTFEKPWAATVALAAGWACLLPLIAVLSRRWDGVEPFRPSH